jgi:uncharacterized protein YbjT (DUF2867 family)
VDVADTGALVAALTGCEVAYYLVHAMAGGTGFAGRDRDLARSFAEAASRAGVGRIVYLGGLGHGDLSEHLASRQEVGEVLASSGVPTVELRAAVVLGAGSISFEMLRYLTERLPVMVCPRWVSTRVQPVALGDLLAYLTEAADVEPGIYDIGSPDVTTYREMMDAYARVRGLRRRFIVKVPVLSPALSAHWVDLVTPVDPTVSHSLIGSLAHEVTVRDRPRTDAAFTVRPLGSEDAVRAALASQADQLPATVFDREPGLLDGVYTDRSSARVRPAGIAADGTVAGWQADLDDCGGRLSWYGWPRAWQLRLMLGRWFGEELELHRPPRVETGADDPAVVLRRGVVGLPDLAHRSGPHRTGRRSAHPGGGGPGLLVGALATPPVRLPGHGAPPGGGSPADGPAAGPAVRPGGPGPAPSCGRLPVADHGGDPRRRSGRTPRTGPFAPPP